MDTAMAYTPEKTIYLCLAHMSEEGIEQKYVKEAFDTNWVVPLGPNVNGFEKDLEFFVGENKRVVALSAGTAAVLPFLPCNSRPAQDPQARASTGELPICTLPCGRLFYRIYHLIQRRLAP